MLHDGDAVGCTWKGYGCVMIRNCYMGGGIKRRHGFVEALRHWGAATMYAMRRHVCAFMPVGDLDSVAEGTGFIVRARWKEAKGLYVSGSSTRNPTRQHMGEEWQSSFNIDKVTERISETLVCTGRKTSHIRKNVSTLASHMPAKYGLRNSADITSCTSNHSRHNLAGLAAPLVHCIAPP